VIHGLTESSSRDSDNRYKEDEDQVINLLHYIKCDEISVRNAVRLGKRPDPGEDKPRPLKLMIASEKQKEDILRFAKNLEWKKETRWNKVLIHQDMTPKQREKRQKLVLEIKARMAMGEANLMIVSGKIVVKRHQTMKEGEIQTAQKSMN
jgi:hypothetical protein